MFSNHDLIDAVANRRFATLNHLEAVVDEEFDEPWFSTGKFGIVFKLIDPKNGQRFALKVFKDRDVEKEERLRQIGEQIAAYPSHYWVSYEFLEDEIRLESPYGKTEHGCAILMEWIEGKTMDEYVKECCEDQNQVSLYKLAYTFDQMALWLLANPFAHGDLKHDNIIIKPNGLPVLVDYDGMYFPIFAGQSSMELGTPDYQHPRRKEKHFGSFLDDFSMLVISLSLHTLAHEPGLHAEYNTGENLILGVSDFLNSQESKLLDAILSFDVTDIHQRLALFDYAITLTCQNLAGIDAILRSKPLYFNRLKELVDDISSNLVPYRNGDKWGLANKRKKILVPCIYNSIDLASNKIFIVTEKGKYSIINELGGRITECEYEEISRFSEGFFVVKFKNHYGFIDSKGKPIINCEYDTAESFSEGFALVSKNNLYGHIDKTGKLVVPCNYKYAESFSENISFVKTKLSGQYGFFNKANWEVHWLLFEDVLPFSENRAAVSLNDKWGFIDNSRTLIIPYEFDSVEAFASGLALVELYGEFGFINLQGDIVVPCEYEAACSFREGMAPVSVNNKWGFIDTNGELLIPCQYESVESFSEGLAAVSMDKGQGYSFRKGWKWGFIDFNSNVIIPQLYSRAYDFSQGLAKVEFDGKWGYIDKKGVEYWEN